MKGPQKNSARGGVEGRARACCLLLPAALDTTLSLPCPSAGAAGSGFAASAAFCPSLTLRFAISTCRPRKPRGITGAAARGNVDACIPCQSKCPHQKLFAVKFMPVELVRRGSRVLAEGESHEPEALVLLLPFVLNEDDLFHGPEISKYFLELRECEGGASAPGRRREPQDCRHLGKDVLRVTLASSTVGATPRTKRVLGSLRDAISPAPTPPRRRVPAPAPPPCKGALFVAATAC